MRRICRRFSHRNLGTDKAAYRFNASQNYLTGLIQGNVAILNSSGSGLGRL